LKVVTSDLIVIMWMKDGVHLYCKLRCQLFLNLYLK